MVLRFHLWLLLAICSTGDASTRIQFSECRGAHGERVFSDRVDCGPERVRNWSMTLPPPVAAAAPEASDKPRKPRSGRGGRRSTVADPRDSYLCVAGNKRWYQHHPCRGSGSKGESVKQTRVSRQLACHEIARPAALLRRGYQKDERVGPYEKATGRDPCR